MTNDKTSTTNQQSQSSMPVHSSGAPKATQSSMPVHRSGAPKATPSSMPVHRSGNTRPLPKTASSLIYRLRAKGYRIDTKSRTVLLTLKRNDDNSPGTPDTGFHAITNPLRRLVKDYGFHIQTTMPSDSSSARVYISGPIAHYNLEERRKAFAEAKRRLRKSGYLPVNPMENGLPQPGDWREHMRVDIRNLLRCQYIYFLPDWQFSKGCRLELNVAMSCGLKVLHF